MILVSAFTEELDAATRAAIIEICVAAHQEEDFRNLFAYVSSGGWHFLAWSGEQLLSHALVTTRWLQPEGHQLLKTAYVDAVASLPAGQGRGFGSAVLRYLADQVAQDYDIACLETERTAFYERLGWERWRGPLAGRSDQGLIPTPEQSGIMILRLPQTPVIDLTTLLTIECQPGRIW
ncbi:MAG: GNAT family N-acetyltransferase [Anaerolinea sp.]|nr:GNAT family N-acetyltransferase [Anaerolinea sp.]